MLPEGCRYVLSGPCLQQTSLSMWDSAHDRGAADEPPGMIGLPPSARGLTGRPKDIAEHASQVAQEWEDVAESQCPEDR